MPPARCRGRAGLVRLVRVGTIALAALTLQVPAWAQTFTVSPITSGNPNFGNIAAAATGTTYFSISPDGVITTSGANGGPITPSTTSVSTVTITCTGNTNQCLNGTANVLVKANTATTGRALAITGFSVKDGTGHVGNVTVNPDGSITFPFTGHTAGAGKTFIVGVTMPIQGDTTTTATTATAGWGVGVAKAPTIPTTTSRTVSATATVRKALSLSKTSDLAFGTIRAPNSGTGTVIISTAGARSIGSGTPYLFPTPSFSAANYNAAGQSGAAVTVSVPASVTLTSGSNTLTATLSPSVSGAQTLNGGALNIKVGGTLTIPSGQAGGNYDGIFTVTVTYN